MDFRLLGPLEVESGGKLVPIARARERAVLASLLLHANRQVSRERLIDELWGERPPATARHTLEAYISRLRRTLSSAGDGARIESRPGGYRIRLDDDELDVLRFERLLQEGRGALARGALADADEKLAAALRLWRGEILADLEFDPVAEAAAARLEELHLAAFEAHAAAALALGHHTELVGGLRTLVAEYPYREALRGRLMLALYRSGRQADALAVYLDGRRRLVDELGIEPSRELQELQQAILRQDPALELRAVATQGTASVGAEPAAAAAPPVGQERRKVVTVVVCELAESTALAERLDPEALGALLARYLAVMQTTVERHGGTFARSGGDGVTAVFGVPLAHEDDALRACRAAEEMRGVLPELGVGGRIGVATGDVIAGGERLATGAAVALAAELAHAARLDEIWLTAETVRLLGPRVEAEPLSPLAVPGAAEPAAAFRFRRLGIPAAGEMTPFVDRERELALLTEAFRRATEERELHLFTILGVAGIGKSRLARRFVESLRPEAQVVSGRCLSYGQAITYWPLAEVLRALGPLARLALERVVSGGASSPQELAWTVQRALEVAAAERPLVVVIEDLHWAELPLLDLLDLICEGSHAHPILLLCVTRPELLERRPGWAGGRLNAASILVEPLAGDACELLVDGLQRPLAPDQRRHVVEAGAGNPLFLEELTEFVAGGGDESELPPRIHALLQARLDRLPEPERRVLCAAAVEGTVFHTGALKTLLPDLRTELGTRLVALTRKLLVRPVPGELEGEEAFCFRHQLIRDTAYAALPKADRARLHEAFAGWLEGHAGDGAELADIAAYHLEQAALAQRELGTGDPALDSRAAAQLAAAGERARLRTDMPAAAGLWRRALVLFDPDEPQVPRLELELAWALTWFGRFDEAQRLLEDAGTRTTDASMAAQVRLARLRVRLYSAPEGVPSAIRSERARAVPLFEQSGNHLALARAFTLLGSVERSELQMETAATAFANGSEQAHRAGDRALEAFAIGFRALTLAETRAPVAAVVAELERAATRFPGEPFIDACLKATRGTVAYDRGRHAQGRALIRQGIEGFRGAGYGLIATADTVRAGRLEMLAGDLDEAERLLLAAIGEQQPNDRGFLGFAKAVLAELRVAQCRYRDALQLADEAEPTGGPNASQTLILANAARARAHAHLAEIEQAKSAAAVAIAAAGATDSLDTQARTWYALAEVHSVAGELPAALTAAEAADRLYSVLERTLERRQVAALVTQIRQRMARSMLEGETRFRPVSARSRKSALGANESAS